MVCACVCGVLVFGGERWAREVRRIVSRVWVSFLCPLLSDDAGYFLISISHHPCITNTNTRHVRVQARRAYMQQEQEPSDSAVARLWLWL